MQPVVVYIPVVCMFLLSGTGSATKLGREFITAFLQNGNSSLEDAQLNITVTAFSTPASVTIYVKQPRARWSVLLDRGESWTMQLPCHLEMIGSALMNSSVLILSDEVVSVTSLSSKNSSSSGIVVHPVHMLGTRYLIVTPNEESVSNYNEFAVINYNFTNDVHVFIKGWVMFQGQNYTPELPLKVNLRPFQVLQLQSTSDLSGSVVLAEKPVAVLSGGSCLWKNNHCNHVHEQLNAVSNWGREHIVHPLPFQYRRDVTYVSASQVTQVNYTSGFTRQSLVMTEGQVLRFPIHLNRSLAIMANASVQVMFFCTGGSARGFILNPFFISVPDTTRYCTEYLVQGLRGFINAVLITAQTESIPGMKFNTLNLQHIQWKKIPETKYSWAQYRYGRQLRSHTVSHSGSAFSVLSVGLSAQKSYGLVGVCTKRIDVCTNIKCRKKESCHLFQGKPICVPDSESLCRVWGSLHYNTFDGLNYDLHGTCTYTVAKTCTGPDGDGGDPTLPEFTIEAKHENCGSQEISCIGLVYVRLHKFSISMAKSEVGFVRVNSVRWPLPLSLNEGRIRVTSSGFHALLETDFIRIRYNWDTFLIINIPSSFSGNVCGLCGNYNDNPGDDFQTPGGVQVPGPAEFGRSWKVDGENDDACWDDCLGPCEDVTPLSGAEYTDSKSCGMLSQEGGPFHLCHMAMDATPYVMACVHDMVKHGGYREVLCQALAVYLAACQTLGLHVQEWRNSAGCETSCPENSRYEACGNACPATCFGKPVNCRSPCIETCECNPGFVLSEGKCVPKSSCGCFSKGRHYPPKEVFWGAGDCTQKCTCNPLTQKPECVTATCREDERCTVIGDVKDCRPLHYGTCYSYGDPHYITFDGAHYDFPGTCRYRLSGLCNKEQGLTDFQVNILSVNGLVPNVSYTKTVWVMVYGVEIILSRQNPGKAMVNGIFLNLPYRYKLDQVVLFQRGWSGVIQTRFGLKVTFDWQSHVAVTVPRSYAGAVCGLCGNFNGDPSDDLLTKIGQREEKISTFGRSWRTRRSIRGCGEQDPVKCAEASSMEQSQRQSYAGCGIILTEDGPFRDCHGLVEPDVYFKDCVRDSCFYKGRQDIFCQVISAYVMACQEARGKVYPWRNETFCNPWCPEYSHYELCASGCPMTCSRMGSQTGCDNTCHEGCVCNNGYVLNVDRCSSISTCGCLYQGQYYKVHDTFYPTSQCEEQCVCKPGGSVHCGPFACKPHERCKILSGTRKCHPTETAVCSATADTYSTFDGHTYHFQSNCCHVLTRDCAHGDSKADLSVTVERGKWGNQTISSTKGVTVTVHGLRISIHQGIWGIIQVYGQSLNLPVYLWDRGIWAYEHGRWVVLGTTTGLQVSYDLGSEILVKVSSSFHGQVCGLCGNFNNNNSDEFQLPDGSLTVSVKRFADGWRDHAAGGTCSDTCETWEKPDNECESHILYRGRNYCGLLLAPDGPFKSCHSCVDPQDYFNHCLLVLCEGRGNTSILCESLQHYVTACQNAGVSDISWRSKDLCPLTCSRNSHYAVCTNACSNSCARITSPGLCPNECAEGCQCDEGYYLDADRCVTLDKCGCVSNGRYYKINETFPRNNCLELCVCRTNGVISCAAHSCDNVSACDTASDGGTLCDRNEILPP